GAVRDCVYDRCLLPGQSGPLCDALATYAAACQAAGATVHPWRSEELCPLSCPPHSHYEVCSYGCPLSCGDLPVPGGCGSECHEGCVCDEGFALSGESCVPLASCGCIHQGSYHPPGQTFYPGPSCDSLCHCQKGGLVSCEPSTCGPHEVCQPSGGSLGCVAVGSATCQASGDPHYTTFDGRRFDFMGTCVYVLAQTCGTTRPGLPSFAVLQENVAWGNGQVSVTRVITVQVANFTLRLEQRQWKVTVNGVDMKLPVELANGQIRVYQHGSDIVIETHFGLRVVYDLVYYVRVTVPGNYYQQMCGLCGDYNGDPKDDLRKPDGSQAGDAKEFGNSWEEAVPGSPCVPPPTCQPGSEGCNPDGQCPPELEDKYQKKEFCGLLTSPTGPLASCHKLVDPQGPLQDCVFDLCLGGGNLSILCSNIHAYVSACQAAGGHVEPWRTETFCPMKCPSNSHYELCADTCSLGCSALSAPPQCPDRCAEGCQCDSGFLYNGQACVPIGQCGCYHNGVYYEPEQTVLIDNCRQQCTCHSGKGMVCQEHSCKPGQLCQPSGGILSCVTKGEHSCKPGQLCQPSGGILSCVTKGAALGLRLGRWRSGMKYGDSEAEGGVIGTFMVNDVLTALPVSVADGRISVTHGASKALLVTDFGLQVSYDWNWRVDVTLPSSYHGAVCGLCGNMDRNPNNDQVFPNGTLAPSIPVWGGSWRAPGWDPLCWDECQGSCPTCPQDKLEQYEGPGFCGPLNFTVTVANEHRGSQAVSYTRSVTLHIYNHSLTLSARWPRQLQVDGEFVALPFQLDSLLQAHLSGADVVVTATSGLSLAFDGNSFVRLRVPAAYAGSLCGLCGNYNQNPADDLKAVGGNPAGWQVGGAPGCGECVSGPCPQPCTPEQQEAFGGPDACGVISATDGPLAPCHGLVPPAQYFQGCLLDACQAQGHPGGLCPAVAAYVAACQAAGAQLDEWRRPDFCPFQCPAHSHYELCGDSCPVSCPSLSAPEGCESACREGCVCDAGFVLSGDSCVPVGQCGCLHDGRYYPLGQAFYPGPECERRCECGPSGHVTCREGSACGPYEECRLEDGVQACHATGCGRCLASGGIHYITLDGRVYDLHGSCSYILAQVCHPKPGDEDFSIVLEKNAAGDPERLLVTVAGQAVSLARGPQVTVDGEAVALPVAVGRVRVTAEGRNMVLQTTKGLRLLFDGDAHILMSIPSPFRGRLCGLCGNFNGNWSDDFVLPSGAAASSVETFGAAWRAPGSSQGCGEGCGPQGCPVCSAEETAPYESNKACGQLRDPQGPFATCQAVLSPSEYFRQCVYDLCAQKGDKAFLCRSLAAYTAACQAAGVAVKPWRTDSFCREYDCALPPLSCPAHSHYSICTRTCQGSCAALSGLTGCTTRCFEGCECDDRYLLSQGVCIPIQDCGCTHNGRYLPVNSSLLTSDCSERCSCSPSSGLTCQAAGCPPGRVCEVQAEARDCWAPRGLCFLSVGANLTTFDGARGAITSPGVYELSSRCPGLEKTIPWYRVVADVQACHGKAEAVGQAHIFFQDGMVTVTPNKGVWVNGLRVDLPAEKLASVSVSRTPDGSLLVHQKAGVQVWLGADGKLAVMVSDDHAGKLCGACGNFDGDQTNDGHNSQQKPAVEKWRAQDFSPW
uniref:VWFD domain-containing protein n=1 Tax=Saimiri boliviensis boliviensis TaxID=39432 RepID=A0A2K6S2L0_SAIBB